MITIAILTSAEGTRKERIKMIVTAIILDAMYMLPIILDANKE